MLEEGLIFLLEEALKNPDGSLANAVCAVLHGVEENGIELLNQTDDLWLELTDKKQVI